MHSDNVNIHLKPKLVILSLEFFLAEKYMAIYIHQECMLDILFQNTMYFGKYKNTNF
jgi:hypothetical protein